MIIYSYAAITVSYTYSRTILCKMKVVTTLKSPVLLTLLVCTLCVDAMGSGEAWMNNNTVKMISLNTSQYCYVDDDTIRIDLNTTTLLSIIDSSEGVLLAMAVGNDTIIFIALLNGSRCMDCIDEDGRQLSTTVYIIQLIIFSITILVAIANTILHLVVKDLRTVSGMLVLLLCINVASFTLIAIGIDTNAYIDNVSVVSVVLINSSYELLFIYQATKLSILYHFAYLMYQSFKLKMIHEESVKKTALKYVIFIVGLSISCFLLALVIDIGVNGKVYGDKERFCRIRYEYTFLYVTVINGMIGIFIILHCIIFAVGLILYFLVSKKCCATKSTNFRVTMALVATVGINLVLLIILTIAVQVPESILIPAVSSGTLAEQLILLALLVSSSKVRLAFKTPGTKDSLQKRVTESSDP